MSLGEFFTHGLLYHFKMGLPGKRKQVIRPLSFHHVLKFVPMSFLSSLIFQVRQFFFFLLNLFAFWWLALIFLRNIQTQSFRDLFVHLDWSGNCRKAVYLKSWTVILALFRSFFLAFLDVFLFLLTLLAFHVFQCELIVLKSLRISLEELIFLNFLLIKVKKRVVAWKLVGF